MYIHSLPQLNNVTRTLIFVRHYYLHVYLIGGNDGR
jgi:hypothetical protein